MENIRDEPKYNRQGFMPINNLQPYRFQYSLWTITPLSTYYGLSYAQVVVAKSGLIEGSLVPRPV